MVAPIQRLQRYVPLLCWIIVVLTLILIPAKILGYGYLPTDDALRHAAKAVCGKSWSEIMVMRPGFEGDLHEGWHAILGAIHRASGGSTESLVVMTCFGLMALVCFAPLPWLRRPEAWLAALFVGTLCISPIVKRLMMGRPVLMTIAVFLTLLMIWSRMGVRRPKNGELIATIVLIGAATWIHGSFYVWGIPAAGILLAGRWRQALWFGVCWVLGSLLGAAITGHPIEFFARWIRLLVGAFGIAKFERQLATELQPSEGDMIAVLAVGVMLLWRWRTPGWSARELLDPIFLTGVLGWVLGLRVTRFWYDWGLPAVMLWMALQFQKQFETWLPVQSLKRPLIVAGLALGLISGTTSDISSRWTRNLTKVYLVADDPKLAGWMPGQGGILYSADMDVFYDTFFKNPNAPWRYILGFEPAVMPSEDLEVMYKVHWNFRDVSGYQPWVEKMRPVDRLVIPYSWAETAPPRLPELEWRLAYNKLWIGRPRPTANPAPK